MNWETYSTLTKAQKEEYNFKFKDNPLIIKPNKLISSVTFFLMVITQFLMVIYLAMIDDAFINLKEQIILLLQTTSRIIAATSIIIVLFLIGSSIHIFYRIYIEHKWMKDNKIEKVKSIPFWKKYGKNVQIR